MKDPVASQDATYVAVLTPPGTAAIATLALHGPRAWTIARALFRPRQGTLADAPVLGRTWVGRLGDPAQGADDVFMAARPAHDGAWIEIHSHGGREVLAMLMELVSAQGALPCSWLELEEHAGMPAWRVAALRTLTEATTVRTAAISLDQYHGAFRQAVTRLLGHFEQHETQQAGDLLEELAQWAPLGRHLASPWRVVIAGPPNVGKSSLVNALAGYQRSVVDAAPGTTRDVVTTRLAIDGWPIELADTAGWREAGDSIERAGIERARESAQRADLCLWVLDASTAPVWPEIPGALCVVNKSDLPAAWDVSQATGAPHVSARTGEGLDELCEALSRRLVPRVPPPGTAMPYTPELCDLIATAQKLLHAGRADGAEQLVRSLVSPDTAAVSSVSHPAGTSGGECGGS
jgi:tRNA modification GTPase